MKLFVEPIVGWLNNNDIFDLVVSNVDQNGK